MTGCTINAVVSMYWEYEDMIVVHEDPNCIFKLICLYFWSLSICMGKSLVSPSDCNYEFIV